MELRWLKVKRQESSGIRIRRAEGREGARPGTRSQTKKSPKALAALLLLAGALTASPAPASALELLAWPVVAANQALRVLWPGMPVRPLPLPPPRPIPRPVPNPTPTPRPVPTPRPAPPTDRGEARPLALTGYRVEGTVQDQVANLNFRITFHNPTAQRMEGVLLIPIPADTVLSDFSMTVGGKKMKAELLESDKAGAIYQTIVNQIRDPGLLELVGERLLRARVFPIEPNGDVQVELAMSQILRKSGELFSLTIPMKSARMIEGSKGRAAVRLELRSQKPIRTLYSPEPAVAIRREDERRAVVSYEEGASAPAGDLNLFFSLHEDPLGAGLLTFKEEGEDGFFLLSLTPKLRSEERETLPRDMVFIVDRSGSMEEDGKMEQARKALSYGIRRLSEGDRFAIVDFATGVDQFETRLVLATKENKARALRYVERLESAGGTNIEGGLEAGLKLIEPKPGRLSYVFFMTDGLPTVGNTDVQALLKAAAEKNAGLRARIFSFGVGSDVNTLFLDKLAETNRGSRDYAMPGENLEHKLSALYQKVGKPALTDLRLEWKGLDVAQVYPKPVTDLFYGSELVLMGRYRGAGRGSLVVTGRAAGKDARFEFPVELQSSATRNAFLPRLWANLKVTSELDAIRLSGRADPEVVNDIVRLAKKYGIVTPYTSFLITEDGRDLAAAQNAAMRQVEALRADAAASGFSGGPAVAVRAQRASTFFNRAASMPAAAAAPPAPRPKASGRIAYDAGPAGGGVAMNSVAAVPSSVRGMEEAEREARDELRAEGSAAVETRSVAGKTFYRRGEEWVDADYELLEGTAQAAVTVEYMSPEYFELVRQHPGLGRYLALGSRLTLVYGGKVYKIVESR